MGNFLVGVDLGMKQDFTAVAVVERQQERGAWDAMMHAHRMETRLAVRTVKRLPLGTPYLEVARRVRETVRHPDLAGRCSVAVDATGVGAGVVEMLDAAGLGCRLLPVVITGGERETRERGYYRVPKRDLITGVQLLLESEELQIAAEMEHGAALLREMTEMRVKVTTGGREQFGTWREREHDDMVLAVALACWGMRKVWPKRAGDEWWRVAPWEGRQVRLL